MPTPARRQPYPIKIRAAEVVRTEMITDTMIRVTFGGAGTDGFVSQVADEHVKLIFPDVDTGELRLPVPDGDHLDWPEPFPTTREYTVRKYRPEEREIDIDFVVHRHGLASGWAIAARPGDTLHVAGPPGGVIIDPGYDHFVIVGDETALPAIARWVEEMPRDTRGDLYIEVHTESSIQKLDPPGGIDVHWIVTPHGEASGLETAVRSTKIPDGASVFVWLAGEAGDIRPLRSWIRNDLGLGKGDSSITGYWRRGVSDTHEHLDEEE
ncbi:siderophore-interacting protein [Rhodococcoides fascians]|uniref:siderophore-interacting protein n=1 Tax=Rhodococcoides fascians TaxID=1828 RepID=UPI00056395B5|nr:MULTISPECIES: siderophore-interacting protein [Rhodococcus]OZF05627.1 siderophore-interacting protein [Rhodococcus sp. 15-1189-1-1a]OZF20409.1 siderophore-interacting protein [Rhodococcus sp. 14-2686-1-2]